MTDDDVSEKLIELFSEILDELREVNTGISELVGGLDTIREQVAEQTTELGEVLQRIEGALIGPGPNVGETFEDAVAQLAKDLMGKQGTTLHDLAEAVENLQGETFSNLGDVVEALGSGPIDLALAA